MGKFLVCLFLGILSSATATTTSELHRFAGTWRGQFKGKTIVTVKLIEHDGKLTGTCIHTTSLEKNEKGELTRVGEAQTEDRILEATMNDSGLLLSIADNGDAQQPLKCVIRLTGKDEGELQIVGSADDKWNPWKIKRVAGS
jgi:hypothetical protein